MALVCGMLKSRVTEAINKPPIFVQIKSYIEYVCFYDAAFHWIVKMTALKFVVNKREAVRDDNFNNTTARST